MKVGYLKKHAVTYNNLNNSFQYVCKKAINARIIDRLKRETVSTLNSKLVLPRCTSPILKM